MQELQDKITAVYRDMAESGKIDEIIKTKLEACVTSILDDLLRSYGPFGRALEKHMSEALAVNLEDLGIGGYQAMVMSVIKGRIEASLDGEWRRQLEASVDNILRSAPASVKLSEMLRSIAEDHRDDAREKHWPCAVLTRETSEYGSTWIGLSPSGETKRYRSEYRLGINEDGRVFSVTIEGREQRALLAGTLHGMERYLFQLQAGGTVVELDLEEGEHSHYYDPDDEE